MNKRTEQKVAKDAKEDKLTVYHADGVEPTLHRKEMRVMETLLQKNAGRRIFDNARKE